MPSALVNHNPIGPRAGDGYGAQQGSTVRVKHAHRISRATMAGVDDESTTRAPIDGDRLRVYTHGNGVQKLSRDGVEHAHAADSIQAARVQRGDKRPVRPRIYCYRHGLPSQHHGVWEEARRYG